MLLVQYQLVLIGSTSGNQGVKMNCHSVQIRITCIWVVLSVVLTGVNTFGIMVKYYRKGEADLSISASLKGRVNQTDLPLRSNHLYPGGSSINAE